MVAKWLLVCMGLNSNITFMPSLSYTDSAGVVYQGQLTKWLKSSTAVVAIFPKTQCCMDGYDIIEKQEPMQHSTTWPTCDLKWNMRLYDFGILN